MEALFFPHPHTLEKGEHLPWFPIKRIPRELPVKFRDTSEHRDWYQQNPWARPELPGHGQKTPAGFGHKQWDQKEGRTSQEWLQITPPPVFHRAKTVLIGSLSFPGPRRSNKMVGSTGQLAPQILFAQTHRKQRFQDHA